MAGHSCASAPESLGTAPHRSMQTSASPLQQPNKRRQSLSSHTPLLAPPPKRQRGPQPKPVPVSVRAAYDAQLNALQGRSEADLYVSNPARLFFSLACRVHVQLMTVRAICNQASDEPDSFRPPCRICKEQRNKGVDASGPELSARRVAQRQLGEARLRGGVVAEVRLLKERRNERYAAADVLIFVQYNAGELLYLLVQVDGAQHFEEGHVFTGQSLEEQERRDEAFNTAALRQGYSVLRLHHEDGEEYDRLMAAAVQLLLSQRRPFLLFSRSYGKEINHSVGSLQQA